MEEQLSYPEWICSLSDADFTDEYSAVLMTWRRPQYDHEHDTEDKMTALEQEKERRGLFIMV